MKRIVTCLVISALGTGVELAQGFLSANNQSTTPITVVDPNGAGTTVVGSPGSVLGPGTVIVSLWVGTNGAPLNTLTQVAIGTNSTSTLPFSYGVFNLGNPLVLPAPWDGTFPVELVYRSWSVSSGATTWSGAVLGFGYTGPPYTGQAVLTGFMLGTGIQPPPPTFGPGLLQGIQLGIIPEPSMHALAGLGLGTLLALYRRRSFG